MVGGRKEGKTYYCLKAAMEALRPGQVLYVAHFDKGKDYTVTRNHLQLEQRKDDNVPIGHTRQE